MFGIIKGFYPSVKGTLLIKSIIFAKKHVNIPDKDKIIVKQTQKSFISSNNEPWVKKNHWFIQCNCVHLQWSESIHVGGNISFIQTFSKI